MLPQLATPPKPVDQVTATMYFDGLSLWFPLRLRKPASVTSLMSLPDEIPVANPHTARMIFDAF